LEPERDREPERRRGGGHFQDPSEQSRLREIAAETVGICDAGYYYSPSGRPIDITAAVRTCEAASLLYRPSHFFTIGAPAWPGPGVVEVTEETVFTACVRILLQAPTARIAILNFASASKAGGGFLNGRQAQEEAIARASALYTSIKRHREMYEFGSADRNPLYSDYMIYSPDVPFFRDDSGVLLEQPFCVSVITAAAPNAKECNTETHRRAVRGTMKNRLRKVIHLAIERGHRVLLLGAFGCGVFGNDVDSTDENTRDKYRCFRTRACPFFPRLDRFGA
jgi:uncharacterized protein (TIGR02452 family)